MKGARSPNSGSSNPRSTVAAASISTINAHGRIALNRRAIAGTFVTRYVLLVDAADTTRSRRLRSATAQMRAAFMMNEAGARSANYGAAATASAALLRPSIAPATAAARDNKSATNVSHAAEAASG